MPYVDRDQAGNIVGVYANAQHGGQEFSETAELWIAPPASNERQRLSRLLTSATRRGDTATIQKLTAKLLTLG